MERDSHSKIYGNNTKLAHTLAALFPREEAFTLTFPSLNNTIEPITGNKREKDSQQSHRELNFPS